MRLSYGQLLVGTAAKVLAVDKANSCGNKGKQKLYAAFRKNTALYLMDSCQLLSEDKTGEESKSSFVVVVVKKHICFWVLKLCFQYDEK